MHKPLFSKKYISLVFVTWLILFFFFFFFFFWIKVLAPLPIGFAVFMVHLATIPITGTGINPARSFGAAVIYNQTKAWDDQVCSISFFFLSLFIYFFIRFSYIIILMMCFSGYSGLDLLLELPSLPSTTNTFLEQQPLGL